MALGARAATRLTWTIFGGGRGTATDLLSFRGGGGGGGGGGGEEGRWRDGAGSFSETSAEADLRWEGLSFGGAALRGDSPGGGSTAGCEMALAGLAILSKASM